MSAFRARKWHSDPGSANLRRLLSCKQALHHWATVCRPDHARAKRLRRLVHRRLLRLAGIAFRQWRLQSRGAPLNLNVDRLRPKPSSAVSELPCAHRCRPLPEAAVVRRSRKLETALRAAHGVAQLDRRGRRQTGVAGHQSPQQMPSSLLPRVPLSPALFVPLRTHTADQTHTGGSGRGHEGAHRGSCSCRAPWGEEPPLA